MTQPINRRSFLGNAAITGAAAGYERTLRIRRELSAKHSDSRPLRRELMLAHLYVASVQLCSAEYEVALDEMKTYHALAEQPAS